MEFYDLKVKLLNGEELAFQSLKGKVVMIVNTASKCGFTYQYEGLEALNKKYASEGLIIIGFPCNQFGGQEPGGVKEINSFCQINYGVTFPITEKVSVNGENTHPVFKWLKAEKGSLLGKRIHWNFTKYLIDKSGKVVVRKEPFSKPHQLEKKIQRLLKE